MYKFSTILLLIFSTFLLFQPAYSQTDEDCLICHGEKDFATEDEEGKPVSLYTDISLLAQSVHQGFGCVTCHSGVEAEMHEEKPEKADCSICHDQVTDRYFKGIHGKRYSQKMKGSPWCTQCHGAHDIKASEDPDSKTSRLNLPELCGECHTRAKSLGGEADLMGPIPLYLQSVHGKLLKEGMEDILVCSDCHQSHEVRSCLDENSLCFKTKVLELCGSCHPDEKEKLEDDVHGRSLESGILSAPACLDCHGAHLILSKNDVRSSTYPPNVTKFTCAKCHSQEHKGPEYGIISKKTTKFLDYYHGSLSEAGNPQAPGCADCHGSHQIRLSSDPESFTHKANLAQTCSRCHPGAGENFVKGSIHLQPRTKKDLGVFWVRRIYLVLIVLVIGGMLLHNLAILFRSVVQRFKESSKGEIIRFNTAEIIQHIILLTSFTTLVFTGFAFRYPDFFLFSWMTGSPEAMAFRGILHRIAGVIFLILCVYNLFYILSTKRGKQQLRSIFPTPRDATHAIQNILYHLCLIREKPKFSHYDYSEKAEYWALVWGAVVMGGTGIILWFENFFLGFMPIWMWNIFKWIHFFEAVLASLAILVWHFFFVFLEPEIYPVNFSMLTGRISEEEFKEKHTAEYEQMKKEETKEDESEE
ncbi:MAG: hypothetical protein AMJ90_04250 [candidate division Zixibacteria bacterium SM23_73_2]|nr:MAG: hypothetical protein AMJ90_04250 [candidate division Zixibacteria bacterium SM23_73_2]